MTFTRNAFDAIIEALDHYAEANEVRVKITNKRKAKAGEEAGQFGVSWWAWEISDPETAEEYAYKITKAAELCRALNDAEIIADPAAAEGINTAEEYEWFVNHYYDEFINRTRSSERERGGRRMNTTKTTTAQKAASERYDRENTIRIALKLNKKTDADIIAHLERQENRQGYIKKLIRDDMRPF